MTADELKEQKIVILSHYGATGACEELRDWLLDVKVKELIYVSFPFGTNVDRYIRLERFLRSESCCTKLFYRVAMPAPVAYVRDFIYSLYVLLRFGRGADLVVAGDNLLTWSGVALRQIANIRHIIYYMIDFTPVRFHNRALNALYYAVDRIAAYGADVVWPLADHMIRGRINAGRLDERRVRWYTVPYGSHVSAVTPLPSGDRKQVVYMGDVLRSKGAELFVPMARELNRLVPDYRFTVIGGGKDLPALRDEVRKAGLEDRFEICGFVDKISDVVERLAGMGVAIAPYYPFDPNSFTFFSDPGKIKVYLGCGVPVVLTDVPPIAKAIERNGAGRIARYDAAEFAKAIAGIMTATDYPLIREAARTMGRQYAWPTVFTEAFAKMSMPNKVGGDLWKQK